VDVFGSGDGPVASCCEHGDELAGFMRGGELVDWLSDQWLIVQDLSPWSLCCYFTVWPSESRFCRQETV
jgi:hypothetical protein